MQKERAPQLPAGPCFYKSRRRPTLPPGLPCSTIGAGGLNFSVRNGKRCFPSANATGNPGARRVRDAPLRFQLKWTTGRRDIGQIKSDQAARTISTGRLNASPRLHLRPINLVISEGPLASLRWGRSHLGASFALRCFQRLSHPDIATRQYRWHDNRYTRGPSDPVLSY
jgi:hypothetical protein